MEYKLLYSVDKVIHNLKLAKEIVKQVAINQNADSYHMISQDKIYEVGKLLYHKNYWYFVLNRQAIPKESPFNSGHFVGCKPYNKVAGDCCHGFEEQEQER